MWLTSWDGDELCCTFTSKSEMLSIRGHPICPSIRTLVARSTASTTTTKDAEHQRDYYQNKQKNQTDWGHQTLYLHVRHLLRTGQIDQATKLVLNDLDKTKSSGSANTELWKTIDLFRLHGAPQQTLAIITHRLNSNPNLQSQRVNLSIVRACNDLVWKFGPNLTHPPSSTLDVHSKLANALENLSNKINQSQLPTAQIQALEPDDQSTRKSNQKVLEVILSSILKTGDLDWLISSFKQFYPRFIDTLGQILHPYTVLNHDQMVYEWTQTQIPSGRLVKFLVTAYVLCHDFEKSYEIIKFYRDLKRNVERIEEEDERDLSPELAYIRGLSRINHLKKQDKRLKMLKSILEDLKDRKPILDSYGFEGMIDMRYRLRFHSSFRQTHTITYEILKTAFDSQLGLFLLHWRRPPSYPPIKQTELIHGISQGQRLIGNWKYRPSARAFTIVLTSLRSHIRYHTRMVINDQNNVYNLDQGKYRPVNKRRPSPGAHRKLLAQILAFEALNSNHCNTNNQNLPNHFRILTPLNVRLLIEILLTARDYAATKILIEHCDEESSIEMILETVVLTILNTIEIEKFTTIIFKRFESYYKVLIGQEINNQNEEINEKNIIEMIKLISNTKGIEKSKIIIRLIEFCCEIDSINSNHHQDVDDWFNLEIQFISKRIQNEFNFINQIVYQPSFSEFTLDFLRKQFAKDQLDLICYGLFE